MDSGCQLILPAVPRAGHTSGRDVALGDGATLMGTHPIKCIELAFAPKDRQDLILDEDRNLITADTAVLVMGWAMACNAEKLKAPLKEFIVKNCSKIMKKHPKELGNLLVNYPEAIRL